MTFWAVALYCHLAAFQVLISHLPCSWGKWGFGLHPSPELLLRPGLEWLYGLASEERTAPKLKGSEPGLPRVWNDKHSCQVPENNEALCERTWPSTKANEVQLILKLSLTCLCTTWSTWKEMSEYLRSTWGSWEATHIVKFWTLLDSTTNFVSACPLGSF